MIHSSIPALRIQKELQSEVVPVYLLIGSDAFLKKYVVDAFIRRMDAGSREFNLAHFTEKDLQPCLDAAYTLPMMSSERLVILEDVSKLKEEDWERLYGYLENPNARTILLLIASKLHDSRLRKIAKKAAVISAKEPDLADTRSMIERSFRKDGYKLESGVVDELLEQVGNNMQVLSQDVEKLKLFRLQEKVISVEDVGALSNRVRQHEIWDLTNQIATRNRRELLLLLHRMFEAGAAPLLLLKIIYSHFVGLMIVKELTEKPGGTFHRGAPARRTESDIAKLAGMNAYYVRRLLEQAGKFEISELKSALREIHRTDSALKGSGLPERMLLEAMLIRIIGPNATTQ